MLGDGGGESFDGMACRAEDIKIVVPVVKADFVLSGDEESFFAGKNDF